MEGDLNKLEHGLKYIVRVCVVSQGTGCISLLGSSGLFMCITMT